MDHVGGCKAILRGLKKRHEATGTIPVLVHTVSCFASVIDTLANLVGLVPSLEPVRFHFIGLPSGPSHSHGVGPGVLTDSAKGMYAYDTIWDDMNTDQLETLPDTKPHRNVDLLVLAADKQGASVPLCAPTRS